MGITLVPHDDADVTLEDIGSAINRMARDGPNKELLESESGGAIANVMISLQWVRANGVYRLAVTVTQPTVCSLPLSRQQLICTNCSHTNSGPFELAYSDEDVCVWTATLALPALSQYEINMTDIPPERRPATSPVRAVA